MRKKNEELEELVAKRNAKKILTRGLANAYVSSPKQAVQSKNQSPKGKKRPGFAS